jgi:hypothetical protein
MLYYGVGTSYDLNNSLVGTDADLDNNHPKKTLRQTVRLRARTVWPYGRTVRCCMRTVRRCTRTVRLGSLGFAQYVATQVHVSIIHF